MQAVKQYMDGQMMANSSLISCLTAIDRRWTLLRTFISKHAQAQPHLHMLSQMTHSIVGKLPPQRQFGVETVKCQEQGQISDIELL